MLRKTRLHRNDQVVLRMEAEEEEIVVEIVEAILVVMAVDAASVVIVVNVVTMVAQAVAVTRRAMAQEVTDQLTKVAEIAEVIQAVQHVRIRTEVAADLMQAKNPGTRNKLETPGRRKRGFSVLNVTRRVGD